MSMRDPLMEAVADGRHDAAIALARARLAADPLDLAAGHHLGLSLFRSGSRREGLRVLSSLLADHYRPRLSGGERTEIHALGLAALQLARLSELELVRHDPELLLNIDLGVRIALEAGERSDATPLIREAEALDARIGRESREGSGHRAAHVRPDSPRVLQVEPTNHCNLDCIMCPRGDMTRSTGFLTLPAWERILESWRHREYHCATPLALHDDAPRCTLHTPGLVRLFFMGEPLLHKKLGELTAMAHARGALVAIQTNGVLLGEERVRRVLLEACIDQLFLSIDGVDADSYAAIRRGGSWERLLAGIRALDRERRAAGLEKRLTICVSTIIPPEIPDYHRRVATFFQPLLPHVDHFFPIPLGQRENTRFLDADGTVVPYPPGDGQAEPPRCEEPLYKMNLLWDGTATPCCYDVDGRLDLGNVLTTDGGVDALWQGPAMRRIQRHALERTPAHPLCRQCLAWDGP